MEDLYNISKEIRILDSEINRYSFLLESDNNIIDKYHLTGDTLFMEANNSNKKQSILSSIINAIKRFITKCKAKFFKLIGSDKYKEYEKELSENKKLANKEVKYNPRTKEFDVINKDTKDINEIINKIKNGTATDEEISRLEEQVHKHKELNIGGIAVGAGLTTFTLYQLFSEVKKRQNEKEKITDADFQFIYQPSLLDPNKTAFSDEQIRQLQKAFAIAKENIEERNSLLLKTQQDMDAILDSEMKELLSAHAESSYDARKLAEKQVGIGKKFKENKNNDINKFRNQHISSDNQLNNYDNDIKNKSNTEKQNIARKLRNEIDENDDYMHSKSLKQNLKDKANVAADHIIYHADYKQEKEKEREEAKERKKKEKERKRVAKEENNKMKRMFREGVNYYDD